MSRSFLVRAFSENKALKLVSLLIAIVLWARVMSSEQAEEHFKVDLLLVNLPRELILTGNVPQNIVVRLSGPRGVMGGVNGRKLSFTLDLSNMREGSTAFEIIPSKLDLPRGVEVTQISPSKVILQTDRKARRRIPVTPRLTGTPAPGFAVSSVTVKPQEVEVEGPEKVLKTLRGLPTETVDVTGLAGGLERSVEFAPPESSIRPLEWSEARLEVKVREISGARPGQ